LTGKFMEGLRKGPFFFDKDRTQLSWKSQSVCGLGG
jgi:hypothetical protein